MARDGSEAMRISPPHVGVLLCHAASCIVTHASRSFATTSSSLPVGSAKRLSY